MQWAGKRVALLGLGRSNLAMARYLAKQGAELVALDVKSPQELGDAYRQLQTLTQVEFHLGDGYRDYLMGSDAIFVSPGIKKHMPELLRAQAQGSLITTEIAYFLERCPAPVLGITGSSGKTTTTTLVGKILEQSAQCPVYVGGNIGTVLIEEVDDIPSQAIVVLELSSFQLQMVRKSPCWAGLTNVRPNHLDIHRDYQEYQEAKANIFRFQTGGDWLVFNEDDDLVRRLAQEAPGKSCPFSRRKVLPRGACVVDDKLVYVEEGGMRPVLSVKDLRLRGWHNVENALAAVALTTLVGVDPEDIAQVLSTFVGVEHRLEEVGCHRGVAYINDSIATTHDRTLAALEAMPPGVLLIAGGYDKRLSFEQLPAAMRGKVRVLLTLGNTAPLIEAEVRRRLPEGEQPEILRCSHLEEAVERASYIAKAGETVLLSPACASFDMFRNYEERGYCFKQLVNNLS